MSNKHTPEPWHVQPDPEFLSGHVVHQHRFITCGIPDITDDRWGDDPDSYIICSMRDCHNQAANARLIAAAPALLAALIRLRDCPDVQMESTEPETDAARLQANAAIAKATGK